MNNIMAITRRELYAYFATPLAYVFLAIFLVLGAVFTFYIGNFFERRQADLLPFFAFHPWLYLFLMPALAMRLWAEERKGGTLELLLTLPIRLRDAVLGKFLAAWLFAGLALLLTFPLALTVNWLGDPDNGAILTAYVGSWFMAGAYLAVGSCLSAATSNQVIAFIVTVVVCFMLVITGFPVVLGAFEGWAPGLLVDAIANLSFLTHFEAVSKGVIDFGDFVYFLVMIAGWLLATAIVIDRKKAG
ncbi:MAG: ABC transporter permease subunit [Gammaproteobacteria bacterium]